MSHTTVRISESTHHLLKDLAIEEKRPMLAVLTQAVEEYRRRRFLESVNAAYAELRQDAEAWSDHLAERREWDVAILDGLAEDEIATEVSRPSTKRRRR